MPRRCCVCLEPRQMRKNIGYQKKPHRKKSAHIASSDFVNFWQCWDLLEFLWQVLQATRRVERFEDTITCAQLSGKAHLARGIADVGIESAQV